jgi:signal transduction histidine kinase
MFSILFSIIVLAVTVLLGLSVFIRDSNKFVNRLFFITTVIAAIWAVNYQNIDVYDSLWLVDFTNGLSYILGYVLVLFVVLLTYYFPLKRDKSSFYIFATILSMVGLLSVTPLIKGTVQRLDDGAIVFTEGPLSYLYVIMLFVGVLIIFNNLVRRSRHYTNEQRAQARLIALGFGLSFVVGVLLTTVASIYNVSSSIVDLAPYSVVFFVIFTTVAISKHKLFDFRAFFARTLSYVLSSFLFVLVYVSVAFFINTYVFPEQSQQAQLIQNIIITVLLVLAYPHVKQWFNKVTKSVFYRDAYDTQAFLSDLNRALVNDPQLDSLLTKAALVIQENLKVVFCTFYIRETSYFPERFIGAHHRQPDFEGLEDLSKYSAMIRRKVHSTEIDPDSDEEQELNKILRKNDVDILVRLVSTLEYKVPGIGYIFLGQKKSGSMFTSQDLKILEIIANELVIAIENVLRFEEIEQFNVTLQKKIDDATKELKTTNEKLRALDEAKDEFVSMASHQLRTPLTSIKGYISMVLDGDAGKITETQKDMLGQAFFSSQRMVYLISDLLNVSRLKTGKFIIEPKPVYLPNLVEDEINQLQDGAKAKNLTLVFSKPKHFPTLNLDDMKIRQVVMNFTDNAIYYTPSGGKITVSLKETEKAVEFTVVDSGIGVPKAQQPKLFTKFYRADNARKARPDGTGLGLFMAKKVVVAQGGSIIFASKENKGSTFGFSFPKEKLEIQTEKPQKTTTS